MFCAKCGTELPDEANFCWKCGADVKRGGEATPPTEFESCSIHKCFAGGDPHGSYPDNWWEARQVGPKGTVVIASSAVARMSASWWQMNVTGPNDAARREFYDDIQQGYHKLVSRLLAQGWESQAADKDGLITTMRRPRRA